MEGFLNIRVQPWLRRLVTRLLAVAPAVAVIWFAGPRATFGLLLLSQVVLNLQLPFAIIPLLQFTNDRKRMGDFASKWPIRLAGWTTALVVLGLNIWLAGQTISAWAGSAGAWSGVVWVGAVTISLALLGLLAWITLRPYGRAALTPALGLEQRSAEVIDVPRYSRILVPLDHSPLDRLALGHAAGLAARNGARLYLLHVEEGVISQVFGQESSTVEVQAGQRYLDSLVDSLSEMNIDVETTIRHSPHPRKEIVRYAREIQPDLLVMGAHGHGGIKDLIFGNTINPVRHALRIPILVVRNL
jgi:manganese transport protein